MMDISPEKEKVVDLPVVNQTRVMAGPGTGKTRLLVARYLKFVLKDNISPDRLLALTFTKKAAGEMQKRIFEAVLEHKDERLLRELYGAWIMNFHQFAFRVIKENAASFEIDPDIGVATEVERLRICRVIGEAFEEGRIEGMPTDFGEDMPSPKKLHSFFDKAMQIVLKARDMLWSRDTLTNYIRQGEPEPYRRFVDTVNAVWNAYEKELRRRSLIDFGDMIRIVVHRLQNNEHLRSQYAGRFEHILVDEFQDTSVAQNELLRLLSGGDFKGVTVVGDDKQSIYRWRDACIDNLRQFKGDTCHLTTNYRSTQGILDLAHYFVIEDPYFKPHAEEIRLEAKRGAGKPPICVFHPREGVEEPVREEARALGAWVASLTGLLASEDIPFEHYRTNAPRLDFADIAILMRTLKPASGLPYYEEELRKLGVPFALLGGVSAIEDRVLELFKNILRLLIYPEDIASFLSIVESKPFLIPDSALKEMFDSAGRNAGVSHLLKADTLSAVGDEVARERCNVLRDLIEDLEDRRGRLDLPTFLVQAMELTQFHYQLFDEGADLRIIESVSKRLFELIEDLFQKREASLAAFVEAVGTLLDKRQFNEEDALYLPEGRVAIMTVHQAKGLEFKAVAIPGIKLPPSNSDGFYLVDGEGLYSTEMEKWGRGTKHLDKERKAEQTKDHEQEERCLHYVAMTRAEDHLFLSSRFANGLEGNKSKKPNLFASVLRSLGEYDIPHEEIRDARVVSATETRSGGKTSVQGDPGELLDEWQAGRERLEEARVLTKPVPQGLQFVTWRGLHTFGVCPLQYYYRYVAGVQEDLLAGDGDDRPPQEEERFEISPEVQVPTAMSPADFGRFVHRVFHEWLAVSRGSDAGVDRVADEFNLRGETKTEVVGVVTELVSAYRDAAEMQDREVHQTEWPVQRRLEDTVFQGVLDRVDRVGDGYQIIDYKIGAQSEDYEYQLRFYGWALGKVFDKPLSGAVCYLHKPMKLVTVNMADDDLRVIDGNAADLVEATRDASYLAKPGKVCAACDYRDICPSAVT